MSALQSCVLCHLLEIPAAWPCGAVLGAHGLVHLASWLQSQVCIPWPLVRWLQLQPLEHLIFSCSLTAGLHRPGLSAESLNPVLVLALCWVRFIPCPSNKSRNPGYLCRLWAESPEGCSFSSFLTIYLFYFSSSHPQRCLSRV